MTFVFTNGNYFAAIILKKVFKHYHEEIKVIIINGDYYGNSKKKGLMVAVKKVPLKFILYKIFVFFGISIMKIFKAGDYSVLDLCKRYNIEVFKCQNVNAAPVKKILEKYQCNYLVSVSCPQIIKKDILSRFRSSINIHSSLLPKYAGLAPYFWVLNNQEQYTGTTVHYMVKKLDEGKIVVQKKININSDWSMFTLFIKLSELGASSLFEAYDQMKNGFDGISQNLSSKTYYSNPRKSDLDNYKNIGKKLIKSKDIINIKPV
jgi:methionyl-tRNA formyltransferase